MSTLFLQDKDPRIRNSARRVRKEASLDRFAKMMKADPEFAIEHQDDPRVAKLQARGIE